MDDIDTKKASQAVIKPHAALLEYSKLPDTLPGQIRGMALIDKIDQLLAEDELATTKQAERELKTALVKERIDQRVSSIAGYAQCIDEINEMVRQLKVAVEQNEVDAKENIPFYRLLKAQVIKRAE